MFIKGETNKYNATSGNPKKHIIQSIMTKPALEYKLKGPIVFLTVETLEALDQL